MGPDSMNDAASPRPGGSGDPGRTPAQKALDFLRTQAFYLAVVILVVVMGGMKTWKELRARGSIAEDTAAAGERRPAPAPSE